MFSIQTEKSNPKFLVNKNLEKENVDSRFRPRLRLKQVQNPEFSLEIDEATSSGRFSGIVSVVLTICSSCWKKRCQRIQTIIMYFFNKGWKIFTLRMRQGPILDFSTFSQTQRLNIFEPKSVLTFNSFFLTLLSKNAWKVQYVRTLAKNS